MVATVDSNQEAKCPVRFKTSSVESVEMNLLTGFCFLLFVFEKKINVSRQRDKTLIAGGLEPS